MQEIYQVAQGHGVALPENVIAKNMGFVDNLPADGTMSMQRDIMEGRPSELEAQNGAVVRLGHPARVGGTQELGGRYPLEPVLLPRLHWRRK
jgi:2-dehydropantoate 2-reductase